MEIYLKKTGKLTLGIMLMLFLFWGCGGGQNRAAKEQLENAKSQTTQNINKYKNEIQERINYVDEEIDNASGELKENLQESRKELKAQKERLEKELENVKNASVDTWNDVVANASESLGKARTKMNEVSKNVREWLDDEVD